MQTKDYFDTLYWLLINAFDVADDPILHKCAMQKYKEFLRGNEGLSDEQLIQLTVDASRR